MKKSYGFIDFCEAKSMMRAFGSKVFVKGKHVRVALSRFAMEVGKKWNEKVLIHIHKRCK